MLPELLLAQRQDSVVFFFVLFHACEEKNNLALVSQPKADFGRKITWHCIFVPLVNTRLLTGWPFPS